MIEFNGDLSNSCKKFLIKKQMIVQCKGSLLTVIPFAVIILFVAIPNRLSVLLFLIPLAIFAFFSMMPPSQKTQKSFVPKRIYIDLDNEEIIHECEKMKRSHPLQSVKSIIDHGEWYYIEFDFANRDLYYICQKDLLTQGTLEDFEILFRGKIKKK